MALSVRLDPLGLRVRTSVCRANVECCLRNHLVCRPVRASDAVLWLPIRRFKYVDDLPLRGPKETWEPVFGERDELANGEPMRVHRKLL
jgi:hypothetical protein